MPTKFSINPQSPTDIGSGPVAVVLGSNQPDIYVYATTGLNPTAATVIANGTSQSASSAAYYGGPGKRVYAVVASGSAKNCVASVSPYGKFGSIPGRKVITNAHVLRAIYHNIQAAAFVREKADGTYDGAGGADIVFHGDSWTHGYNATRCQFNGWVHRFKVKIQDAINHSSITAGYGFLRESSSAFASGNVVPSDIRTLTGASGSSASLHGLNGNVTSFAGASSYGNAFQWILDGTHSAATYRRMKVGRIDLFYMSGNSGIYATNNKASLGDGSASALSGGTTFGIATGSDLVKRLAITTYTAGGAIDPTHKNYLAVGVGTPGNLYTPGAILYGTDTDRGVRVHNLGASGAQLSSITASSAKLLGAIGDWTTLTGSGATNCKAFIASFGLNELTSASGSALTNWQTTSIDFKTNLEAYILNILANQSSNAKIVFLIPLWRDDQSGGIYQRTINHPVEYVQAYYDMAAKYPDVVALIDLPVFYGIDSYLVDSGWHDATLQTAAGNWVGNEAPGSTDDVHQADPGHDQIADLLVNSIVYSDFIAA